MIIVGGGLAGLSAAHQAYYRGANVVLLDKQGFLSGNSGKATSGINGALTRTQVKLEIKDSVEQFYQDTLATARDRANPELIRVLSYNSADAVHWLQEIFQLDLSVISRLGGHSQPRTHRGKDAKFPGMAITYKLLETLENLAMDEPARVAILKDTQVIDLISDDNEKWKIRGVRYKNLKTKEKKLLLGPVILATGGYAADFTKNSLLRKYRPDIVDLPLTNGVHATGDGQKIVMKNHGVTIDMDKIQVHPTGLIEYDDLDTINGKKKPRFLFLGAEALRGEGGIIINRKGERFCDELGTRDYLSGEIQKQERIGNGPFRLVLNSQSDERLSFHLKHYNQRKLMRNTTGEELAKEMNVDFCKLQETVDRYNQASSGYIKDPYGKKYFPSSLFDMEKSNIYHVAFIARVLHFTMGGIKIDDFSRVIYCDGSNEKPFEGLYAAGEVAGGIHGHNRLGGSSLLACVVFGRLSADQATGFLLQKMSKEIASPGLAVGARDRLNQINLHLHPETKSFTVSFANENREGIDSRALTDTNTPNKAPMPSDASPKRMKKSNRTHFKIPLKEFTAEEVAKHNKPDDCWVIIKNVVMDATSFLDKHPGGRESIIKYAGQDATESFEMLHEDNVIPRYAPECVLGRVKGQISQLEIN